MRQIKRHEPYCNKIANHIVQVLVVNCLCLLEKGGICILIQQPCSLLLTYNTGPSTLSTSCCYIVSIAIVYHSWTTLFHGAPRHCSRLAAQHCSHLFTPVQNLEQFVTKIWKIFSQYYQGFITSCVSGLTEEKSFYTDCCNFSVREG